MRWPLRNLYTFHRLVDSYRNTIFQMGRGFQVWRFHLKVSLREEKPCLPQVYDPWEASFSSRGLIFGGEDISIPEQGLLYLDGRNSQKYLHQDQAYF